MKSFAIILGLFLVSNCHIIAQLSYQGSPTSVSAVIDMPATSEILKDVVEGKPYLLDKWAKASFVGWTGTFPASTNDYTYNLDLRYNDLLAKDANGKVFKTNKKLIKSFTLTDGSKSYLFEEPKNVNFSESDFFQVIYKTDTCFVYKSLKKTIINVENKNIGLSTDELPTKKYESQNEYYVKFPGKPLEKTRQLSLKMFKAAFPNKDKAAFEAFCSKNKIKGNLKDEDVAKVIEYLTAP